MINGFCAESAHESDEHEPDHEVESESDDDDPVDKVDNDHEAVSPADDAEYEQDKEELEVCYYRPVIQFSGSAWRRGIAKGEGADWKACPKGQLSEV